MLIELSKIIEQDKITLLNMKSGLINKVDLINVKDLSSYELVNYILQINYTHEFMQSFRKLVKSAESKEWKIDSSLVIKYDKLMISNINNLQTHLIKEVHASQIIAHSDKIKTTKLLSK